MRRSTASLLKCATVLLCRAAAPHRDFLHGDFTEVAAAVDPRAGELSVSSASVPIPHSETFVKSLFTSTGDFDVAHQPTGSAAQDRVVCNTELSNNPFQASCIEIRLPQHNKPVQTRKKKLNFAHLRHKSHLRKEAMTCGIAADQQATSEEASNAADPYRNMEELNTNMDEAEVVFYYETSTDKGLMGFQYVAAQVQADILPGRCENATAVGGFATWIVPRPKYLEILRETPQLENAH